MEMLNRVSVVQNLSIVVDNPADEIGSAGLFCPLYGGTEMDTLTSLSYAWYMSMMVTSSKVEPQQLPPTEHAAHYHSLSVYLQVVRWTVLSNDMLQAKEWKMGNNSLSRIDRPGCGTGKSPTVYPLYVQVNRQEPFWNQQCSCQKNGLTCYNECRG